MPATSAGMTWRGYRSLRKLTLLAFDVEFARDRAPGLHLAGQEGAQLWRACERHRDLLALGELRGNARLAQGGRQLGTKAGDHLARRAGWRKHAPPRIGFKVGKAAFADG